MGAYSKNTWQARTGTGLNRYTDQNNNVYEFTASPTEIMQQGTPFSAEWMNHIEEGIYACSLNVTGYGVSDASSATLAVTIEACENIPLATGQVYVINFQSSPLANATLNINGTGAKPLYMVYPFAAVAAGDLPAGFIAFIAYDGSRYVVLNRAWQGQERPAGSQLFTSNGSFTVPNGVYSLNISACGAGIGRNAGEWTIDESLTVTPGEMLTITVGTGNTVIKRGSTELITLTAGTKAESTHTTKLGYAAGYNGGWGWMNANTYGYGGAFGFGGGSGGGSDFQTIGGGGAGKGGDGTSGDSLTNPGAGGGSTGGNGGNNSDGSNAREGTIIYAGGASTSSTGFSGGGGSVYGAGGGGASKADGGSFLNGCGGAAGGYGAGAGLGASGAGTAGADGTAASGMVLIEWGGAYV